MVKTTNQIIIMWLIIGIMKGVCFFLDIKRIKPITIHMMIG